MEALAKLRRGGNRVLFAHAAREISLGVPARLNDNGKVNPAILGAVKRFAPYIVICLLLVAVCFGVRSRSRRAVAPPIYDAINYYQKGATTWQLLRQGKWRETLNAEPAFRPPGTVLMTFPFGFDGDMRGFFFRCAFVPVLFWSAALAIVILPLAKTASQRWVGMGLATALMTLPMFYHYEFRKGYPGDDVWGFQDSFLGALAALAAALLMTAARNRSYAALALGAVAGAWTMLVKPSGILLPPVFLWLWGIELLITNWPVAGAWRADFRFRRYAIFGLALQLVLYGLVAWACFHSQYLSPANIAYGLNAQKVHAEMESAFGWWRIVRPQIVSAFGWHWFVAWLALIGWLASAAMIQIARGKLRPAEFRFLAGALVMAGGFTWWIKYAAGPDSVRYVYMFILIPILAWIPEALERARDLSERSAALIGAVLTIPLAIIALLLPIRMNAEKMEWALSINLSAGKYAKEVKMGEYLAEKARKAPAGKTVSVYSVPGNDLQFGVLDSVWRMRAISNPVTRPVYFRWPMDWQRSTVIRKDELVTADYLFFEPPGQKEGEQVMADMREVKTYRDEFVIFSAWLGTLTPEDGVRRVMGQRTLLIEITDRPRLTEACDKLIAEHRWRDVFLKENAKPLQQ